MPRKTKAQLAAEAAELAEAGGLPEPQSELPDTGLSASAMPPNGGLTAEESGDLSQPADDGLSAYADEQSSFPAEEGEAGPEFPDAFPPAAETDEASPHRYLLLPENPVVSSEGEEALEQQAPLSSDEAASPLPAPDDESPAPPATNQPPDPLQEQESAPPAPAKQRRARTGRRTANSTGTPPAGRQASAPGAGSRQAAFRQLDFKTLDKDLSPEQLQEWQSIYASFRSESILTGVINGVDSNTFIVTNKNTGLTERRTVLSLVIISYRVKILIPETEIWMPGEERPEHVIRGMIGSEVDYVIMDIDRAGDCAIASRRMAMAKQQRRFRSQHAGQEGIHVNCRVIAVGPKRCLVECGGYDLSLTQRDLSYTAIADLRREYMPGQQLEAVFKGFSTQPFRPVISVKEVNPNPFDGAEARHPVRSRRHAVISGKYAGGVFCVLPDGVTCLCLYSNKHYDAEFAVGDKVIILITQYDYRRKLIYARIIAKW